MVKTKQMARKGANFNEDRNGGNCLDKGYRLSFPIKENRGKAAMHMQAGQDDDYTPSEGGSSTQSVASQGNVQ